jgi:hypothetical protein
MTSRFKFVATAALGLVLAAGTLADASARTVTHHAHVAKTQTHVKIATKGHRLHVAHLRHAHKLHVAHRKGHVVKATGLKTTKEAGTAISHRERHAENHRVATKPVSVVR